MKELTKKIHDAWKEIKKYQTKWGEKTINIKKHGRIVGIKQVESKLSGNLKFPSYSNFKEHVLSALTNKQGELMPSKFTKAFIQETKMRLRYKVSYKVAKNAYEIARKNNTYYGEIGQIRKMETTDIAEMIKEDIKDYYKKRKAELGPNHSYEIRDEIAEMYFGS